MTTLDSIGRLEDVERAWYEAHDGVPGVTVESSDEIAWMRGPGVGWSNAAIRVRLPAARIAQRLRAIFKRAFSDGRGFGVWVSDRATPADLTQRLTECGFRSRKRFPAMMTELGAPEPAPLPKGLRIEELRESSMFDRHPHPYFGPITTAIRRFEMTRLEHLRTHHPSKVVDVVALRGEVPVGAATVFLEGDTAVFHDVGVIEGERNRGIGSAVMLAGCSRARERGARRAVLLSSGMGFGMYQRIGFREIGRIAYWYAAKLR